MRPREDALKNHSGIGIGTLLFPGQPRPRATTKVDKVDILCPDGAKEENQDSGGRPDYHPRRRQRRCGTVTLQSAASVRIPEAGSSSGIADYFLCLFANI
jgi:hypothetical protein